MRTVFLVLAVSVFVLALVYAVAVWAQARSFVSGSPKEEMFVCPTHGAISKNALMYINADEEMEFQYQDGTKTRGKVPYCPRCFESRIAEAKARYK